MKLRVYSKTMQISDVHDQTPEFKKMVTPGAAVTVMMLAPTGDVVNIGATFHFLDSQEHEVGIGWTGVVPATGQDVGGFLPFDYTVYIVVCEPSKLAGGWIDHTPHSLN